MISIGTCEKILLLWVQRMNISSINVIVSLSLGSHQRAEFMLWDEEEEEYCSYREGFGAGNWRSPEEYHDEYLTEQVDVFSLGNNMYGLLTGSMVFYEIESYGEIQDLVGDGEKAYIDPRYKERSLAEAKLVEIINQCHEYYPEDRPSIFEVVDMLWQALEEVNEAMDKDKNNEI
uniref:Protein kinase domain-containing protein n=1 Tax=Pseudo-nitzschia australis TaxID=44445 RepID=A0A7S4EG67_9STRA